MAIHKSRHVSINRDWGAVYDECFYYAIEAWDGGVRTKVSGTGASVANYSLATDTGHFGVLKLDTGSTSTGRSGLGNDVLNSIQIGAGPIRFGSIVKMPVKPSTAQNFEIIIGLADVANTITPNGIYFEFARTDDTTTRCSGVAYDGVAPGLRYDYALPARDTGWHTYEIVINADATRIYYYIDGTLEATNYNGDPSGGHIPTGNKLGLLPVNIIKSAGTNASLVYIDAYWLEYGFTTTR